MGEEVIKTKQLEKLPTFWWPIDAIDAYLQSFSTQALEVYPVAQNIDMLKSYLEMIAKQDADKRRYLIPLYFHNRKHCTLLAIDRTIDDTQVPHTVALSIDSLRYINPSDPNPYEKLPDDYKQAITESLSAEIIYPNNTTRQQQDGYECGTYVMLNAKVLTDNQLQLSKAAQHATRYFANHSPEELSQARKEIIAQLQSRGYDTATLITGDRILSTQKPVASVNAVETSSSKPPVSAVGNYNLRENFDRSVCSYIETAVKPEQMGTFVAITKSLTTLSESENNSPQEFTKVFNDGVANITGQKIVPEDNENDPTAIFAYHLFEIATHSKSVKDGDIKSNIDKMPSWQAKMCFLRALHSSIGLIYKEDAAAIAAQLLGKMTPDDKAECELAYQQSQKPQALGSSYNRVKFFNCAQLLRAQEPPVDSVSTCGVVKA